jgi:hypothetical protein
MSSDVYIFTKVYFKNGIYWKDEACTEIFVDQAGAKQIWDETNSPKRRPMIDLAKKSKEATFQESVTAIVKFVALIAVVGGGVMLWTAAKANGWIWHEQLSSVFSGGWMNGEYKDCTSENSKTHAFLDCGAFSKGEYKQFKVRFYGLTYDSDKPENFVHNWKCHRNGQDDPAITCEMPKSD